MDVGRCHSKGPLGRGTGCCPPALEEARCLNVHLEQLNAFAPFSPPLESCFLSSLFFGRLDAVVILKTDFGILGALILPVSDIRQITDPLRVCLLICEVGCWCLLHYVVSIRGDDMCRGPTTAWVTIRYPYPFPFLVICNPQARRISGISQVLSYE